MSDRLDIRDQHGRRFRYLRIAITEHCNLRCIYCMPPEGVPLTPRDDLLSKDEILRVVYSLIPLGLNKVRLTGGEPLLRSDLLEIISELALLKTSEDDTLPVHLTSNGIALNAKAEELKSAGLRSVNISLDTLRKDRYEVITRRNSFEKTLSGLDAARKVGLKAKINTVMMRGFNDDEIKDFIALADDKQLTIRLIELMPFDAQQVWRTGKFFGVDRMLEAVKAIAPSIDRCHGTSTEEYMFRTKHGGKIALIPAYSRTLCGDCDRIRLTADGQIRNCLFSDRDHDLRTLIRNGASELDIADFIRKAMWQKAIDGRAAQERSKMIPASNKRRRISMTEIGG